MPLTTQVEFSHELINAINKAVKTEMEREFDELMKEFEKKKAGIIAGVLLSMQHRIDMQTMRENIVFTIENKP